MLGKFPLLGKLGLISFSLGTNGKRQQMTETNKNSLSIIAGRGNYPLLLAKSARKQGGGFLDVEHFGECVPINRDALWSEA